MIKGIYLTNLLSIAFKDYEIYVKVPITIVIIGIYLPNLICLVLIDFKIRKKTGEQTNLLFLISLFIACEYFKDVLSLLAAVQIGKIMLQLI